MATVLVIGATGHVGQHFVEQALARGSTVRAVARRIPPEEHVERLEWIAADVLDAASVLAACAGVESIINASGVGTSRQPTTLYSAGT